MHEMNHDRAIGHLTEGGFSPDQSKRLLTVIEEVVTTRALTKQDLDLAMLAQRGEFNEKMGDLRTDLNGKIANLRTEMTAGFSDLRAEGAALELRVSRDLRTQTLQLLGGMSAIVAVMLALQKLL